MTITEFLTARLDEEESALRAIQDNSEPWRGEWAGDEANFALRTRNGWSLARAVTVEAGFPPGVLAHIVRYDPARVLRDVDAKRRILADRWGGPDHHDMWEHHLRLLAAVYDDHPDYRLEWKP